MRKEEKYRNLQKITKINKPAAMQKYSTATSSVT